MWIFMFVGAIPFVVVFGIIVYNVIHARINYSKSKEAMFNIILNAKDKSEKNETCAYCGTPFDEGVCPSCGARSAKKQ